jgi:hypothetical protein
MNDIGLLNAKKLSKIKQKELDALLDTVETV